ncbi:hypothetical protein N9Y60_05115 [Crocinitomicaceae bacterium]|nr:hypothetical protein [Crocinitomicaceae bacterium]MDC0257263.1 hypothetical protein [Crocinitomicaceae bacterium]
MSTNNYYIAGDYTNGGSNSAWQETGLTIPEGVEVNFKVVGAVSGLFTSDTACNSVGPGGADPFNTGALVPSLNNCAAIGKVGENGKPFLVADNQLISPTGGGTLYLAVNDSLATDNKGGFFVEVSF